MCIDGFGVTWMVNIAGAPAAAGASEDGSTGARSDAVGEPSGV
jgi:hypothetical protein